MHHQTPTHAGWRCRFWDSRFSVPVYCRDTELEPPPTFFIEPISIRRPSVELCPTVDSLVSFRCNSIQRQPTLPPARRDGGWWQYRLAVGQVILDTRGILHRAAGLHQRDVVAVRAVV